MDSEQRTRLDESLGLAGRDTVPWAPRARKLPTSRRIGRKVPPWWKGDAGASESSLAAARQFGFKPLLGDVA